MKEIENLDLGMTLVKDLEPLKSLSSLKVLNLRGSNVSNLQFIARNKKLSSITLDGKQLSGLSALQNLSNLSTINVIEGGNYDLISIGQMRHLQHLMLWGPGGFLDLAPLESLKGLLSFDLSGLGANRLSVANIEILGSITSLQTISLGEIDIQNVSFLANLSNLKSVALANLPLSSIDSMKYLPKLETASIIQIPLLDVSPLLGLANLKTVALGRTLARSDAVLELQKRGVRVTQW